MMYRVLPLFLMAVALGVFVAMPALAQQQGQQGQQPGQQIQQPGQQGQQPGQQGQRPGQQGQRPGQQIERPGQQGQQPGQPLRRPGQQPQRTADRETAERGDTHQGTVVSVTENKLTMRGAKGDVKEEHSHTLAPSARVTIDGREAKPEDLKPGMRIRVTTKQGDKTTAVKIEAFSKDFQQKDRDFDQRDRDLERRDKDLQQKDRNLQRQDRNLDRKNLDR